MPKVNAGRILQSQRQRALISKKSEKFGASTVYLQVLGSGARGSPNTLYLFTDQKRYLFNCGEGSQRLAHEHKVKLSKLEQIFITNKTWKNIGGLPGLSLTLQDVGVPNITLHGPEGLDELYNATKRFVVMKEMNVTMATCKPSVDFEDSVMTVKYVILAPQDNILQTDSDPVAKKAKLCDDVSDKEFEEFIHDNTDYYKREGNKSEHNKQNNCNIKATSVGNGTSKKDQKVLNALQKHSHCTVAYICILHKRLGTLDLEKCVEFGVKPGPLLGKLKSGQDVMLPDGTLVLSKDVKTPDDPGPVFIVLEVPDLSYLKESEFSAHFDNGTNPPENIATVIVHYTPPHVFNHPTYRAFLAMFGPTTRHLVLNTQNSCLGSESVHRTQHKLHLLDNEMFPLLRDTSLPAVWDVPEGSQNLPINPVKLKVLEELKHNIAMAQFQNIINMEGSSAGNEGLRDSDSLARLELIAGRSLTIFHLRPKKQLDRSMEPKLHIQEYIQEPLDVDGFVGSLEHFRKVVEDIRYAKRDSQIEYPKVVFLGTGSCIPSKTRNTSGIVLRLSEDSSMLLDCGEGTFTQLVRFYGPKRVNSFLRSIKAIYISHLHADHHIGLIGILQARREALDELNQDSTPTPLYLLAPGQIVTWLSMYHQQFERIREEFILVPNQSLLENDIEDTHSDLTSAVLSHIGAQDLRTCYVAHCPNAFAIAVDVDQHHKISYSGDTIPCDELVYIGKDSTLLIHEATMEDELEHEARIKMHSTTSQAINIGKKMNAKFTVLTHFSQRYARLPRLSSHILKDNHSVGIAFDNMQITMSDLELLPRMYAPLQLMFAEHCIELEMKAEHRARQKDRKPIPAKFPTSVSPERLSVGSETAGPRIADKEKRFSPRRKSPSYDTTLSLQNKQNVCSRLRQERRSRFEDKKPTGLRSKSCSPNKLSSRNTSPIATKCGSAPQSPERSSQVAPHRTSSQSSNVKAKNPNSTNVACVIETRSKTLNKGPISTASYTVAINNFVDKNKTSRDVKQKSKENTQEFHKSTVNKMQRSSQSRSPTKSPSVGGKPAQPVLSSKTSRDVTVKLVKSQRPLIQRETHSSRQSVETNLQGLKSLTSYNKSKPTHVAYTRDTKVWHSEQTNLDVTIKTILKKNSKENMNITQIQPASSSREHSRDRGKFAYDKHNVTRISRKYFNNSKCFTPQLEDIKSSFLILNKKPTYDESLKVQENNDNDTENISKAKYSEEERRKKLIEAMNKFKSKKYWNDSKYERIEGLNWISWK